MKIFYKLCALMSFLFFEMSASRFDLLGSECPSCGNREECAKVHLRGLHECLQITGNKYIALHLTNAALEDELNTIVSSVIHKTGIVPVLTSNKRRDLFHSSLHFIFLDTLNDLNKLQNTIYTYAAPDISTHFIIFTLFEKNYYEQQLKNLLMWVEDFDIFRISVFFYDTHVLKNNFCFIHSFEVFLMREKENNGEMKWNRYDNLSETCNERVNENFLEVERSPLMNVLKSSYKVSMVDTLQRVFWTDKNGSKIYDGPDYRMVITFQETAGINVDFVKPPIPMLGLQTNGSFNGMIGEVQFGRVDFSGNSLYVIPEINLFADYTASVIQALYCVVLRKAPIMPFGTVLLLPYKFKVWAVVIFTMLLVAVVWYVLYAFSTKGPRVISVTRALFDTMELALTGGISRQTHTASQKVMLTDTYYYLGSFPLPSSVSLARKRVHESYPRVACSPSSAANFFTAFALEIFGRKSWSKDYKTYATRLLFLSLVLGNAYTGQLLGFLAAPPRYKDPTSLEEVAAVIRKVYIHGGLTGMFKDPDAGAGVKALSSKLETKSMADRLALLPEIAARREDGAFMSDHRHYLCSRMKELTEDGEVLLHMVPECVYHPGQSGFIVRKNSAFYYVFNRFVLRAVQAGLYDHWMHAQSARVTARGLRLPDAWVGDQGAQRLSLKKLAGPFAALGAGLAAGAAAFGAEVLCQWLRAAKRIQNGKQKMAKMLRTL